MGSGGKPRYVTEEEVEQAMRDCYVTLPIADAAALAEAFNKVSDCLFGERDD